MPFRNSPNCKGFEGELVEYLNAGIDETAGTMVIFTSMKQMKEVANQLKPELKAILLMQGNLAKHRIIEKHKLAICDGKGSIIFGVDSFSEGVDLQGKALTHVICVKIKFDIPNDPISKTAHWFYKNTNRNPFNEIEIPKAAIRLIQTCGRLIRTEQDTGKITLLDNRLIHKGYGKTILNSLPMKVSNLS
jgi:ATP-dependent DNA helicase DinG